MRTLKNHRLFPWLLLAMMAVSSMNVAVSDEAGASRAMVQAKRNPAELRNFLLGMPKGADLHTHLSGAVYAEDIIDIALHGKNDYCIDGVTFYATRAPCQGGQRPISDLISDGRLYDKVLAAWSMRGFIPGDTTGHDHFFAAFEKFGAIVSPNTGNALATIAQRAAEQNVQYIEPLMSPAFSQVSQVADRVTYTTDFPALRQALLDNGLLQVIPDAKRNADVTLAQMKTALGCDTATPKVGCQTAMAFGAQISRGFSPVNVFAQLLFAFELMEADPRWVALNMVQPEDSWTAVDDYALHMQMIRYLKSVYPNSHVSLHAGELTYGLVPPDALRFHVRDAVNVAGAERIGHGVDILWEDSWRSTMRAMRNRHVCVEINLTSNKYILGVSGKQHPMRQYLKQGVPVTIATDDEGIERTDITGEYQRAVLEQDMSYLQLKKIARAGLECSYLPEPAKQQALRQQREMFMTFEKGYN